MKVKLDQKLDMLKKLPYKFMDESFKNVKNSYKNNKENLGKDEKETFSEIEKKEILKLERTISSKKKKIKNNSNKKKTIKFNEKELKKNKTTNCLEKSLEFEEEVESGKIKIKKMDNLSKNEKSINSYKDLKYEDTFKKENSLKGILKKRIKNIERESDEKSPEEKIKMKKIMFMNKELKNELSFYKQEIKKLKKENRMLKKNVIENADDNKEKKNCKNSYEEEILIIEKNNKTNLEKVKNNYEMIIKKMLEEAEKFDLDKLKNLNLIETKIINFEKEKNIFNDFFRSLDVNLQDFKNCVGFYINNFQNNIKIDDYEILTFLLNLNQKFRKLENDFSFLNEQIEGIGKKDLFSFRNV